MILLCFELSMPRRASWDGKWSGDNISYARIEEFPVEKAAELLKIRSFYYDWDDGWQALVTVKQVDSEEAFKIQERSKGFCGYDWMVKSIIEHNEIKVNPIVWKTEVIE